MMIRQTTRGRCHRLAGAAALLLLSGCSVLHWSDVVAPQSLSGDMAARVEPWRAGDWRIRRDWSPLAALPQVRRSGLVWSQRRWAHPGESEWEREFLPPHRHSPLAGTPDSPAGHTAPQSTGAPSDTDRAGRFAGLPADLRIDLAIWLAEVDPELSREISDLGPIVASGRIGAGTTGWPELGPIFNEQAARKNATPTERDQVSDATRLAAARAWCFQLASRTAAATNTETALIPAGQLLTNGELPAAVQAELLRTLGNWLPPGRIPRLAESLAAEGAAGAEDRARLQEACLEAGLAWLATSHGRSLDSGTSDDADSTWWRAQLRQMERPASISGRFLYDANLVLLSDSDVTERLIGELPTLEWGERERVAMLIGLSRDSRGVETLQNLLRQSDDGSRLLGLRGLATRDDFRPETYVDLPPRLRIALAECLAEHHSRTASDTRTASSVAMRLIVDPHPQVAAMMLVALERWSAADATPILLVGLVEGSYKTRRDAFRRLQELHGPFDFSIDAEVRNRRDAALVLRDRWKLRDDALVAGQRPTDLRRDEPDPAREGMLQAWLDRRAEWATAATPGSPDSEAESVWSRFTVDDIPYLERQLGSDDEGLRRFLGDDLLPRLSPAYAAFRDLRSNELAVRRRAAALLRNEAANRSLPGPILVRLAGVLRDEQDREVWRSTLLAVENEASPEAAELARIAAETAWPDLRLLALDYTARHRPPGATDWILPLLAERHPQVQREAVRVAGLLGDPVVIEGTRDAAGEVIYPGLRVLLVEANGPLRSAVILSLAQLGDNQGLEELARLARDEEPATRAAAIRAMGETGHSRFLRTLIEMLWTETSPTVQTAGLQALTRLVPEDRHPPHDAALGYADRLQAWADVVKSL